MITDTSTRSTNLSNASHLSKVAALLSLTLLVSSLGCVGLPALPGVITKRAEERCCPTDIRQVHRWVWGEDALFDHPTGPDENYHGHRPTCWTPWQASAPQWRDDFCGGPPGDTSIHAVGNLHPVLISPPSVPEPTTEQNSDAAPSTESLPAPPLEENVPEENVLEETPRNLAPALEVPLLPDPLSYDDRGTDRKIQRLAVSDSATSGTARQVRQATPQSKPSKHNDGLINPAALHQAIGGDTSDDEDELVNPMDPSLDER